MKAGPRYLDDIPPIRWGGEEAARFLLRGSETAGRFSFYEVSLPVNEGSILHLHQDMDETFFAAEGEFAIRLDEEEHLLPQGAVLFAPRKIAHAFRNTWHKTSKMLCVTTPGGIEDFFEDLAALMSGQAPPAWESMRDLAARHRIVAYRP
jgi:quercetin dioxygenase-like cupin family protein